MSNIASQVRKEEAVRKRKKIPDPVRYQVEGSDIVFIDGKYGGQYASHLFQLGPTERDYVTQHLWFSNDESVMQIIRNWLCQ